MKRISLWSLAICLFGLFLVSACGGGGGGSAVALPPAAQPVAIVTLSTAVTGTIPAGTTINGYEVTMTLPADVTCKSAASGQTDPGVVTVIGQAAGSLATGMYTAASASQRGTVKVTIVSGPGFGAGAFCTVQCELANGVQPTAADFKPLVLDAATGLVSGTTTTNLTSQLTVTASVVIQ